MKKIIVIGNWKMYKTEEETVKFIEELVPLVADIEIPIYLAVPFTSISAAAKATSKANIVIGAQNMNDASEGAFTGEISAKMLKNAGADFVLLGHSERRQIFKETDNFINHKVIRAIKDDLQPVLCVGETIQEREEGKTEEILKKQLTIGLNGVLKEDAEELIIAYEPVWAIGTGKTATPQIAEKAHAFIRKFLDNFFGKREALEIPILYGGSVKPENIADLIKEEDINGALVGGASLNAQTFYQIIKRVI